MAKTQTKSKKQAADAKNLVPELRKNVLAAYRIKHCLNPDLQDLQINMIIKNKFINAKKERFALRNPENPLNKYNRHLVKHCVWALTFVLVIREIGVQTIG